MAEDYTDYFKNRDFVHQIGFMVIEAGKDWDGKTDLIRSMG